jgi:hypothetical protein
MTITTSTVKPCSPVQMEQARRDIVVRHLASCALLAMLILGHCRTMGSVLG